MGVLPALGWCLGRAIADGTVTIDGTTFTWPDVPAGTPENVVTGGQTVEDVRHPTASKRAQATPDFIEATYPRTSAAGSE